MHSRLPAPSRARPVLRLTAVIAVVVACTTVPTGMMCGCPPARTHLYVAGVVAMPSGAPVVGARVFVDVRPANLGPVGGGDSTQSASTGRDGAFGIHAYSSAAPAPALVRLGVVLAGSTDTLRFDHVVGTLRRERTTPDTVRLHLTVP